MTVEDVPRRLASARSVFKIRAGDRPVKTDKTALLRFTSEHDVCEIATVKTKNIICSYCGIVKVAYIWLEQRWKVTNSVLEGVANQCCTA